MTLTYVPGFWSEKGLNSTVLTLISNTISAGRLGDFLKQKENFKGEAEDAATFFDDRNKQKTQLSRLRFWRGVEGGKSNDLTAIRLVIASARNMVTSVPRLGVTRRKQPNLPNTSIYYHATQLHRLGNGAIWETLQVLFPFRGGGNFKYCEQAS